MRLIHLMDFTPWHTQYRMHKITGNESYIYILCACVYTVCVYIHTVAYVCVWLFE